MSWASKKQTSVALSSTESEYMALSKATAEAIWLCHLLQDLGFPQSQPTLIYADNQSVISLINPKFHSRSKHIDTQYHFTRDQILNKQITLKYVSTIDMVADIFTKNLPRIRHLMCMQNLGNQSYIQDDDLTMTEIMTPPNTSSLQLQASLGLCESF